MLRKFDNNGSILIITFILILILTAFSFALFFPITVQSNATKLSIQKIHSLNIAEAALANAINDLKNGGNGILGDSSAPLAFSNGLYFTAVTLDSPSENKHTIFATGQHQRVSTTVTATIKFTSATSSGTSDKFVPPQAILMGDSLKINGTPDITGTGGGIHSNGSILINGSAEIQQTVSAAGVVEVTGGGPGGGPSKGPPGGSIDFEENVEPLPLPEVKPESYKEEAEYILAANGQVLDQSGVVIHDTNTDGNFQNWSHSDSGGEVNWSYTGTTAIDGAFYIEGNVKVTGSPKHGTGPTATPWKVTIIATGHIQFLGSPSLIPFHSDQVSLIAGTDLKLNGTSSTILQGFFASHEQMDILGSPQINGAVYAESAEDLDTLVSLQSVTISDGTTIFVNSLSGTPNINYDGDLETFLANIDTNLVEILGTAITYEITQN